MQVPVSARILRMAFCWLLLTGLAACQTSVPYFAEPSPHLASGRPDPRLVASRAISERAATILQRIPVAKGRLSLAPGFEDHLLSVLQPLDIVMVRSPRGPVRNGIPSYFTHAIIWLGTKRQLMAAGLWNHPSLVPYRSEIEAGNVALEAINTHVHLMTLQRVTDRDVLAIVRAPQSALRHRGKVLARALDTVGRRYDTNLDFDDRDRLTCAELVMEVFPSLMLPVRYSLGRRTLIPDDIVRLAAEGEGGYRLLETFATTPDGRYFSLRRSEVQKRLTSPARKPPFGYY